MEGDRDPVHAREKYPKDLLVNWWEREADHRPFSRWQPGRAPWLFWLRRAASGAEAPLPAWKRRFTEAWCVMLATQSVNHATPPPPPTQKVMCTKSDKIEWTWRVATQHNNFWRPLSEVPKASPTSPIWPMPRGRCCRRRLGCVFLAAKTVGRASLKWGSQSRATPKSDVCSFGFPLIQGAKGSPQQKYTHSEPALGEVGPGC